MRRPVGVAWLAEEADAAMLAEAERAFLSETGGILMGYWVRPPEEVVITAAIGPGPGAVHAAWRFVPDADFHEREAARHYEASGRLDGYLGDWHTHPLGDGRLSRSDRRTLRLIARSPTARASAPLMAILAGGPAWDLAIWRAMPARRPIPLFSMDFAALVVRRFRIRV